MRLITFKGTSCQEGMEMGAMAEAMGKVAKADPGATMDSVDQKTPVFLHWTAKAGPGVLEIQTESSLTRKKVNKPKVFALPGNAVVRLRTQDHPGMSLAITPSGAYATAIGVERPIAYPLQPAADAPAHVVAGLAWLRNGRRGMSSEVMCRELTGQSDGIAPDATNHPRDGADFRRCVLFLEAVPQVRQDIGKLAGLSPQWSGLVEAWGELETLFAKEDQEAFSERFGAAIQEPPRPKRARP